MIKLELLTPIEDGSSFPCNKYCILYRAEKNPPRKHSANNQGGCSGAIDVRIPRYSVLPLEYVRLLNPEMGRAIHYTVSGYDRMPADARQKIYQDILAWQHIRDIFPRKY